MRYHQSLTRHVVLYLQIIMSRLGFPTRIIPTPTIAGTEDMPCQFEPRRSIRCSQRFGYIGNGQTNISYNKSISIPIWQDRIWRDIVWQNMEDLLNLTTTTDASSSSFTILEDLSRH
jgi:hypothetical protein